MTFALITEGISEHRIIRHILLKYFKGSDPEINQIQPKILHDKQTSIGSWNEVLKYCTRATDLRNIFVDNDYLIIQIDTDQSQTKPFDISHTKPGNTLKTIEELYNDTVVKLKSLIDPGILQLHADKIFFAISIHTIECWLLPIYYSNKHKSDTSTCIPTLNVELKRHNILSIPTATKNKNSPSAIRTYDAILKNWKRKQDIVDAAQHNAAFQKFIESMAVVGTPKQ